jgi:hypothetical protein
MRSEGVNRCLSVSCQTRWPCNPALRRWRRQDLKCRPVWITESLRPGWAAWHNPVFKKTTTTKKRNQCMHTIHSRSKSKNCRCGSAGSMLAQPAQRSRCAPHTTETICGGACLQSQQFTGTSGESVDQGHPWL